MHPIWHFVNGVPTIGAPVNLGPLSVSPTAVTSTVPYVAPDGSAAAPSYGGGSGSGFNIIAGSSLRQSLSSVYYTGLFADQFQLKSTTSLDWSSGTVGATSDVSLSRGAPALLNSNSAIARTGANGQAFTDLQTLTELTTIAAAATTDTTIQMPAGAVVLGVSVRVTVAIPTATTFTVGDSGSAARFSTAAVSVAANSTDAGTKAGAYYNASALSIRITPNGTPAANTGRVRVTIYYYSVTPPTS